MTSFTPRVAAGVARADYRRGRARDRLMAYYGSQDTGLTVWQDQALVWHEQQYPYAGRDESPGLLQARRVYQGGHIHEIGNVETLELIGAGYLDRLNIADREMVWREDQISKLTISNMSFTSDGAVPATPTVDNAGNGVFTLSAGPAGSSGARRDFWLHSEILYSNFDVETTLNAPDYNVGGRLQQGGICLRYIESGGTKTAITLNNNVFFVVPVINVGVWRSNLDGTGFVNRQTGFPVESLFNPSFPFKLGARLTDNIVQVRLWQDGTNPPDWSNDLTSQARSKAFNLDTDCGDAVAIPTPTGRGQAGFIAAHLGTTALYKFGKTRFHNPDNQGIGIG